MMLAYSKASAYYKSKNEKLYNMANNGMKKYVEKYSATIQEVSKKQKEYDDFSKLQRLIDSNRFGDIKQEDYKNISLFGHSSISESGCGYIATVIAAKLLGENVRKNLWPKGRQKLLRTQKRVNNKRGCLHNI